MLSKLSVLQEFRNNKYFYVIKNSLSCFLFFYFFNSNNIFQINKDYYYECEYYVIFYRWIIKISSTFNDLLKSKL